MNDSSVRTCNRLPVVRWPRDHYFKLTFILIIQILIWNYLSPLNSSTIRCDRSKQNISSFSGDFNSKRSPNFRFFQIYNRVVRVMATKFELDRNLLLISGQVLKNICISQVLTTYFRVLCSSFMNLWVTINNTNFVFEKIGFGWEQSNFQSFKIHVQWDLFWNYAA